MTNEILVIDDNSDIRQLISSILKDASFTVREAANFDQAMLEINKKLPDVAIVDVKLDKGDNDGIELLTYLKKIDEDVPVIMISITIQNFMSPTLFFAEIFNFMLKLTFHICNAIYDYARLHFSIF